MLLGTETPLMLDSTFGYDTPPQDVSKLNRYDQFASSRASGRASSDQVSILSQSVAPVSISRPAQSPQDTDCHLLQTYISDMISSEKELPHLPMPQDRMRLGQENRGLQALTRDQRVFVLWCWDNLLLLLNEIKTSSSLDLQELKMTIIRVYRNAQRSSGDISEHISDVRLYFLTYWKDDKSVQDICRIYLLLLSSKKERLAVNKAFKDTETGEASKSRSSSMELSDVKKKTQLQESIIPRAVQEALRGQLHISQSATIQADSNRKSKTQLQTRLDKLDQMMLNPVVLLMFVRRCSLWHVLNEEGRWRSKAAKEKGNGTPARRADALESEAESGKGKGKGKEEDDVSGESDDESDDELGDEDEDEDEDEEENKEERDNSSSSSSSNEANTVRNNRHQSSQPQCLENSHQQTSYNDECGTNRPQRLWSPIMQQFYVYDVRSDTLVLADGQRIPRPQHVPVATFTSASAQSSGTSSCSSHTPSSWRITR